MSFISRTKTVSCVKVRSRARRADHVRRLIVSARKVVASDRREDQEALTRAVSEVQLMREQ